MKEKLKEMETIKKEIEEQLTKEGRPIIQVKRNSNSM